jgi:acylphosphatase
MPQKVRFVVSGTVQGVFYRAWTEDRARALGLKGWVRNLRDGTVEVVAGGGEEAVERLGHDLHEGPPAARVTGVEREACDETLPDGFELRY